MHSKGFLTVIMIIIKGIIPYDDIDKDIRSWFGPFRCDDMDLPDRQQAYRNCKRIQQGYFCKRLIPETEIWPLLGSRLEVSTVL